MTTKDVATQKPAGSNLPISQDLADQLAGLSGLGFGNATMEDYALPFLHVLQKMSPEVDKADPKYVEGAEPGMLMNSVTQELFDGAAGIIVIPVEFQKAFNIWVPRNSGGGFKGTGSTRDEAAQKQAALVESGFDKPTDIVDTSNHYILMRSKDGKLDAIVLSCTSTKMKASRSWMSLMARVTINGKPAPMFAKKYALSTISQKNDKGTFFNIKAEVIDGADGWVSKDELAAALEFHKQLKAGKRGADFSQVDEVDGPLSPVTGEEVAF
jgi:hypothetical protein